MNSNIDNIIVTEDDPLIEKRTYDRIIKEQWELHPLIKEALRACELGLERRDVVNISNYKIECDFNLVKLLQDCGLSNSQSVKDPTFHDFTRQTIECPFEIKAVNAHFFKPFSTFDIDYSKEQYVDILFNKEIDFKDAVFEKNVEFINCTFKEKAIFHLATFKGYADFNTATFKKGATFTTTTFYDAFFLLPKELQGNIEITTPKFESEKRSLVVDFASCRSLISQGKIIFKGLETDHDRICLKVRNLKEGSNVKVHFQDCGFYGKNVAFTNVDMKQVNISGGNYVAGMSFYHCEWAKEPVFFGLEFRAFNRLISTDIPKIAESYGNLKVSVLDAGDAQLSNDFHFWHQWHQWENLYQQGKWNWNYFYLITSAYGLSARLPFSWFVYVIAIFMCLYGSIFQESLENSFLTSLSASIPFVFNDVEVIQKAIDSISATKNLWFYPLYILQHLVQGYLLFQIGAAIRNKVKR